MQGENRMTGTDQPMSAKITRLRVSEPLCICGHLRGSHKYGMCYGNWMSCKCKEFQLPEESKRVYEITADHTWEDVE